MRSQCIGPLLNPEHRREAGRERQPAQRIPNDIRSGAADVKECSLRGASYVKKLMPAQHFVNPMFLDPELDLTVRRPRRDEDTHGVHFEDVARHRLAIPAW